MLGRESRYVYAGHDLDDDGTPEVFVYLLGGMSCGSGGCQLALLQATGRGYRLVDDFPIARLPVTVLGAVSAGWRDLLKPESGGGAPRTVVRYAFDGSEYVERERVAPDQAPRGTDLLTGTVSFDGGAPLRPARRP